jgi:hypothetical protein
MRERKLYEKGTPYETTEAAEKESISSTRPSHQRGKRTIGWREEVGNGSYELR